MKPKLRTLVDISDTQAARDGQVASILDCAKWASQVFQRYDLDHVRKIAAAVATIAEQQAGRYAEWAVEEGGFGVAAHKKIKNEIASRGILDAYSNEDFVNPRIDVEKKIVEVPRSAGVVFALVPSTNPISTIYFKIILCLLTRNALVLSPHPTVRNCSIDAVKTLASEAERAGAPAGCIQVVEQPNLPLVEAFMASPKTDLVLATGGAAMVRAAYSSSNPAIGVGPGNAPVFVDETANLSRAAERIVDSKSFDNSILCSNESVLITLRSVETKLCGALKQFGAHLCNADEKAKLQAFLFPEGRFNTKAVGQYATWIAEQSGFIVAPNTRILLVSIVGVGPEEVFSREKLCPVLGFLVVENKRNAISQARALVRLSGAGHSCAIHTADPETALAFANAVEVYRCVVNAPCSQGAAGFHTNLSPSFTIGTGFFGRSSVGENITPQHLVHWTRLAYNKDRSEQMGDFSRARLKLDGALVPAPNDGAPPSSRLQHNSDDHVRPTRASTSDNQRMRDELRQIVLDEIRVALREHK